MKKIERPDWESLNFDIVQTSADGSSFILTPKDRLDKWFDEYVDPVNKMIDEAVEVYQKRPCTDGLWYPAMHKESYTHRALLINIQPIKQETCADVLRDFLTVKDDVYGSSVYGPWKYLFERARLALEREQAE